MTSQILLIVGPTASGKTSLSVGLAKALGGEIINADSMQVYEYVSILSARPTKIEMDNIPHKLFGCISPTSQFSVADWHKLAKTEVERTIKSGKTPILVGGTGLYFKAALEGLAPIPIIPNEVREKVRERLNRDGSELLYEELIRLDPECANRLKPGDGQRVARAIEVKLATGTPLSEWQENNAPGFLQDFVENGLVKKVILEMPRDILYDRINARFDRMVVNGALEEVQGLMNNNIPTDMPAMKALGIPSFMRYLKSEVKLDIAIDEAKTQSRRYAKRQMTWFRNQFTDWQRINPMDEDLETHIKEIIG